MLAIKSIRNVDEIKLHMAQDEADWISIFV